jgi:hypothetical protein
MKSAKALRHLLRSLAPLICCLIFGGLTGDSVNARSDQQRSAGMCDEVICIRSDSASFEPKQAFRLFVTINNNSADSLPLTHFPYLTLVKGEAPKDLEVYPAKGFYSRVNLPPESDFMTMPSLGPQKSMSFDFDMTQTLWGWPTSSYRPSDDIFAVVPKGQYSLYLRLETEGADGSRRYIFSNVIMVTRK